MKEKKNEMKTEVVYIKDKLVKFLSNYDWFEIIKRW